MAPPTRTTAGPYHYHAYDYAGSVAFTPTGTPAGQFYSMVKDLEGLVVEGQTRRVPNIGLTDAGPSGTDPRTGVQRFIKVLSLGNRNDIDTAPTVVFTGGVHAREWVGAEMAYLLAEYLIINYSEQPSANPYVQKIKDLVDTRNIRIVPMVNPDGNYQTIFGVKSIDGVSPMRWRKNCDPLPTSGKDWLTALTYPDPKSEDPDHRRPNSPFLNVITGAGLAEYDVPNYDPDNGIPPRADAQYIHRGLQNKKTGVDLNRNCATQAWGYECSPGDSHIGNWNPNSESYFGPNAASETETKNIRSFLAANKPVIVIDYHSSGQAILYPSEVFNRQLMDPDYFSVATTLHVLIQSKDKQSYKLGSPLQVFGNDGTGAIADYAAEAHSSRAFVIELDPAESGGKNPAENDIRAVFEKNIRGALAALAVPDAQTFHVIVVDFLKWDVFDRGNQLPKWE
jgi:hypothetical protein